MTDHGKRPRDAVELLLAAGLNGAAAKHKRLQRQREAAYTLLRAETETIDDLRSRLGHAEGRAHQLRELLRRGELWRREPLPSSYLDRERRPLDALAHSQVPDERQLREAEAEVTKIEAEMAERREVQARLRSRWDAIAALLRDIDIYLHGAPRGALKAAADPAPARAANPAAAVEAARARLGDLGCEVAAIWQAPLTAAELKAAAAREIAALAERGAPVIEAGDGSLRWPAQTQAVHGMTESGPVMSHFELPAALPFMAWLHRDALLDRVEAAIDALALDGAMTAAERAEREAELLAEILAAERGEERAIEQASDAGLGIDRRPDADPRAVLGIDGPRPGADR